MSARPLPDLNVPAAAGVTAAHALFDVGAVTALRDLPQGAPSRLWGEAALSSEHP